MTGSLQLREYPGEIVRLSCQKMQTRLVAQVRRKSGTTERMRIARQASFHQVRWLRLSVNGERSSCASPPLSSLIIVVAMMAMMMTPIVATGIISVGAVTTVIIRSPPAPAIATADPTYLLHVRRAVCRDWCDRHCSRCGRCYAAT